LNINNLDYSQVKIAVSLRATARERGNLIWIRRTMRSPRRFAPRDDISRGPSLRMPCNEADAVRSACLNGKKMAIKIKYLKRKTFSIFIFEIILYISENKLII
jgi:hypothetical protein